MARTKALKIKAGALQYVIFIGIVIALLVFAFILLSYTQKQFRLLNKQFIQSVKETDELLITLNGKGLTENQTSELQTNKVSSVMTQQWGLFEIATATAGYRNQKFTKFALLGGHLSSRNSLYLQDEDQPLVVVGNTKIEGAIRLPKQGIKRGSIAGTSYSGSQLYYGVAQLSTAELPKFLGREALRELVFANESSSEQESFDLTADLVLTNSFNEPTKVFQTEGFVNLSNVTLTGNILIKSNLGISLDASSSLTDVILIAPKISIGDQVRGNFQALATEEIIVGKACELAYPSVLVVYQNPFSVELPNQPSEERNSDLIIGSKTRVKGLVAFFSEKEQEPYKTQISLEKETRVVGEVYCQGNLELQGSVVGSVITQGFMANQFGNLYKNHIYNGQILTHQFPKEYVGLWLDTYQKKVVKWLY